MTPQEFKTLTFQNEQQWNSGLLCGLEVLKGGGISLYPMPAFEKWILKTNDIKRPGCLAVDECGQIYFIDLQTCQLYCYDPKAQRLEQLLGKGGCGSDAAKFKSPSQIIMDKFTLWVVDTGNNRVQAFSRENFQIKYIIDDLEEPIGMALDGHKDIYILESETCPNSEQEKYWISKYDYNGHRMEDVKPFGESVLKKPIGLEIGVENKLYVVDIDQEYTRFRIFTSGGEYSGTVGGFKGISGVVNPTAIAIDRKGNIFVAFVDSQNAGQIHQFDADGSHIGKIADSTTPVLALAVDSRGNLYASSDQGIALFNSQQRYSKVKGCYYSRTLDSGIEKCQWHRLALQSKIPAKTIVEVYYYSSDDSKLKTDIDQILSGSMSAQKKAEIIDEIIDNESSWFGPTENPQDLLFQQKTGRYLWLKLALSTLDEKVRPTVIRMQVYYPRISYLRYLPAIYQENAQSKAFLEKFLSIFESLFYELETDISQVFRYFDPQTVPQNFLSWLGSWLNFALEEDWPDDTKREFIRQAATLYKKKGTPAAIKALVKIYCGVEPSIIEHARNLTLMVLGRDIRLGVNSTLLETTIRGFRLGDDSILGRTAIRKALYPKTDPFIPFAIEDPFLPFAHRFTVLLNMKRETFNQYDKGIRRILEEATPAHTEYRLRAIGDSYQRGEFYVGINSRVAELILFSLGTSAAVGYATIVMTGDGGVRLERNSVLGRGIELM